MKHTLSRSLVALALMGAALASTTTANANNYSLAGNPGYQFPGSPYGDSNSPPPPETYDMAYALQISLGVTVTVVGSLPYENTALGPRTVDSDTGPYYGAFPWSDGTLRNGIGTVKLSGITSAQIHYVGTDRVLGRVDLNRYVVRLFTATRFYDGLLKVTSTTGSTTPNTYYSATWSFWEVSAPRNTNALLNISSRAQVFTGQNVLIAGFIVSGSVSKNVLVRGIGPSLGQFGIPGAMSDPTLELRNSSNTLLASNNDWQDTQSAQIQATGAPPSDYRESAIVASLAPGSYTATLKGYGGTTGVAICEIYDIDQSANSQLVNLSSRAYIDTGDNALFAGLIVGGTNNSGLRVIIRALGPSLAAAGVVGPLQDPTLEVRNANGAQLASNDNWQDTQAATIQSTGVPPSDYRESAVVVYLQAGNYTAIARGLYNTTGVGVLDMYKLQ